MPAVELPPPTVENTPAAEAYNVWIVGQGKNGLLTASPLKAGWVVYVTVFNICCAVNNRAHALSV